MGNPSPNVAPAIAARRALGPEKEQAVLDSLATLAIQRRSGGQPITKALVLKAANVSKSFLYSHPELLKRVDEVVRSQSSHGPAATGKRYSDRSTVVLIAALQKRCADLEQKLTTSEKACADYMNERKRLFGKIADLQEAKAGLERRLVQSRDQKS